MLEPTTNRARERAKSPMELVAAALPKAAARPVAVGACQRRAQWSTLLVPRTARANFWMR